ncbi:unnamed protein product [Phaeothamnion confervicola]
MSAAAELPTQAARQQALYDLVYVERIPEEAKMSSGLLLPGKENPRMHVCKVISIGSGREGESGIVVPNAGIQPGDLVYVKDPWGIGPRDDEFSFRKFSFVKYQNICAVLPNSRRFEDDARAAAADKAAAERAAVL